jgi:signal transduction histidine kinase/sensor domain CHASE-containing protein
MSIRKKITIFTCVILFVILASCYALVHFVLFTQLGLAEKKYVETSIADTESICKSYSDTLSSRLKDWAWWDDTYQYVQDKNSDYEDSNLGPNSISQVQVDMMVFLNLKGEIVRAVEIDPEKVVEIPFSSSFASFLQKNKDKFIAKNTGSKYSGITVLPEGPLIFSSMSILKSNGEGPLVGSLVFGTHFDKRILDYISNITHLNTQAHVYSDKNIPPDFELAKKMFGKSLYFVNPLSSSLAGGYLLVKDEAGSPGLIIRIDMSRNTFNQGIQAMTMMFFLIVFVVCISIVTFYILLNKFVISKIIKLNSDVSKVRENKDVELRISLPGGDSNSKDEVYILAKNINSTIDELAEIKSQEKEESDQLKIKIEEFEKKNKELEDSQRAIVNVLDDTKQLEEELEKEKESVEAKVMERTSQLAQEQARLQASISSLPVGFVMTDAQENVIVMNGIAKSILCYNSGNRPSGALTKNEVRSYDCNLDEIKDRLKNSFDAKLAIDNVIKYKKPFELKELTLDDMSLHIFITPITIMEEEEFAVIGSVMLIENITEQKIIDRSKDEFFSIASHELRTPLTAIRGNTSMILDYYKDQLKDPQVKEMIDDVHESSIRLIEIVNDFLDTSRLELGKMEFKKTVVDLAQLIPIVIKEYQVTGSRKRLHIGFENTEKMPSVAADTDRLRQVLINLIGNGLKFTTEGGITISLKQEGDFVKTIVSDTGIGISEASQKLLFRKFQQAENNIFTRDTTQGTGLGLYVSKMIVEGMGGKIKLESSVVNKGSVFSFTLPIAK